MENQDWAVLSVLWLIAAYATAFTVLTSSPVWAIVAVLAAGVAMMGGVVLRRRTRSEETRRDGTTQ